MKTKQLVFGALTLLLATSLTFTGCRKDREEDNDTTGAEEHAMAEQYFEDLRQMANESQGDWSNGSFKNQPGNGSLISTCAVITINKIFLGGDSISEITIDFGPTNCLCLDGRYRRGKVFISFKVGTYWTPGAFVSVSTIKASDPGSDSYYVNDNHVSGTVSVANKGKNAAGHTNWDLIVNGSITKANNGGNITWSCNLNREWATGESTFFWWLDDSYALTGSASGTSSNGKIFSMQITSPLIRKIICPKHFVEGSFDFTHGTHPTRHVDYSYSQNNPAGSCDGWIAITINGKTYYKQLP